MNYEGVWIDNKAIERWKDVWNGWDKQRIDVCEMLSKCYLR